MKTAMGLLAVLLLGACASSPPGSRALAEVDRLALYQSHAGAPVSKIRYLSSMGWDRIDAAHVLLNMRPKETWLLTLSGPCLDWGSGSPLLTVDSNTGWLISKFDSIKLAGSQVSCRIDEIRPVDLQGVRAAEAAMRDQASSGT